MGERQGNGPEFNDTEPSPAEILAPAPVLGLGAFLIGVGLHLLNPISVFPTPLNFIGGGILVVVGVGILLTALRTMHQINKSPPHEDEPSELLTDGPFKYTRNPLYLGIIVIYLGLTGLLNSLWPLAPLLVLVWYFDRVARREEAYLDSKFGDEFSQYRENVRRWL